MKKIVLLGASTGGPGKIKEILNEMPPLTCPMVISQHMQEGFLPSFVSLLNTHSKNLVRLSHECLTLENIVYICRNSCEIKNNIMCESKRIFPFSPNVDLLFSSAARLKNVKVFAILLTGIGDDGALGLLELFNKGANCVAENEASCIVYGMPKKAFELNNKLEMLDLKVIKSRLYDFLKG